MANTTPPDLRRWILQNLARRDHVGSTLHFEGYDTQRVAQNVAQTLRELGLDYREEHTQPQATLYTFLAQTKREDQIYVWVTVGDRGPLVLVETKVFHETEDSAYADELLTQITQKLYRKLGIE